MKTTQLTREFSYNGVRLADPSSAFSLEQVRDFYSATYPEILNADIEGPAVQGNQQVYTFRRAVGTKGATEHNAVRQALETGSFVAQPGNSVAIQHIDTPLARSLITIAHSRYRTSAPLMPTPASLPLLP